MSIHKYLKKRDFSKTSEPKGSQKTDKLLSFVVQRHHAMSLHYDLRLEVNGVLKSWAVPKGPSLNPKDKRLAMMVEDHPLDYKNFEGEIPKGNYGAGVVNIWDFGTYEPIDGIKSLKKNLESGDFKFKLSGKKLKGEFALIKIRDEKQNAWLLIKHRDEHAVNKPYNSEDLVSKTIKEQGKKFKSAKDKPAENKPEKEPSKVIFKPMLATLSEHIFDDNEWVYEKKFDGYRILAHNYKTVELISRNKINYSKQYQKITDALKYLPENTVIDGELVIEDKNGLSNFQALQNYEKESTSQLLKYYVFDILLLNDNDVRDLPLLQRKKLIQKLLLNLNHDDLIYVDHEIKTGKKLYEKALKNNWEGVIAKKAASEYSNLRSEQWLKFKLTKSIDAIICGYTKPSGSRKYFGALILGIYKNGKLEYIGNCGTGFTDNLLKSLYVKFENLIIKTNPFIESVEKEKSAIWLKPKMVCEVNYSEFTQDKHLRHPVFKGLRSDKKISEINIDTKIDRIFANDEERIISRKKVHLSNLNKVFWPQENIKKGDLLAFYESVADKILPFLKDKPLSLNRHPNGINGKSFFQKDIQLKNQPDWIKTVPLYSESTDKEIEYLICNNAATLLYMVNLGCIEINPWLSSYKRPDKPDFMVIDLDPHDVDFKYVVKTALKTKEILNEYNINSFIKTSGSKGLHIYIYLAGRYYYKIIKDFAQLIAQLVNEALPDFTSIIRNPSLRKNKIYIDYLQNRKGQTVAAPYSVRPKTGATISTPLYWDEIVALKGIEEFNMFTINDRLRAKLNPWEDIYNNPVILEKAFIKKP